VVIGESALAEQAKAAFPQAGFGFSGVKQFNCESARESALTHAASGVSFGL